MKVSSHNEPRRASSAKVHADLSQLNRRKWEVKSERDRGKQTERKQWSKKINKNLKGLTSESEHIHLHQK